MREETVYLDSGACEHYIYVTCKPLQKPYCVGSFTIKSLIYKGDNYDGKEKAVWCAEGEEVRYIVKLTSWEVSRAVDLNRFVLKELEGKRPTEASEVVKAQTEEMILESIDLSYRAHGEIRDPVRELAEGAIAEIESVPSEEGKGFSVTKTIADKGSYVLMGIVGLCFIGLLLLLFGIGRKK